MANCRQERKAKTKVRVKDLAKLLDKTSNYITNIENGHATPSGTLFFEYLLAVGFDLTTLNNLRIETNPRLAKKKQSFVNEIYEMDELTINFLKEQLDLLKITLTQISVVSVPKGKKRAKKRTTN